MLKLLTMGTTMVETWLTGSCSLELLDAALTYWRFKTEFPCFLSEAFLTPQDWKGRKLPGKQNNIKLQEQDQQGPLLPSYYHQDQCQQYSFTDHHCDQILYT